MPRDGGAPGTGIADGNAKTISVTLDGKQYQGTYTFDGGSVITSQNFSRATAFGSGGMATAFGNGYSNTYVPGSGNGRILAFAPGDALRCEFNYRGQSGIGVCQNNAGRMFDLVIGGSQTR